MILVCYLYREMHVDVFLVYVLVFSPFMLLFLVVYIPSSLRERTVKKGNLG